MNVDTRTAGGDTKVTKTLSIQIEMKKKGCKTDARLNASIDFLPFFSYSFSPSLISYMYTAAGTYRIFFIITLAQPMKYCGCLLFCCPCLSFCRYTFSIWKYRGPNYCSYVFNEHFQVALDYMWRGEKGKKKWLEIHGMRNFPKCGRRRGHNFVWIIGISEKVTRRNGHVIISLWWTQSTWTVK